MTLSLPVSATYVPSLDIPVQQTTETALVVFINFSVLLNSSARKLVGTAVLLVQNNPSLEAVMPSLLKEA